MSDITVTIAGDGTPTPSDIQVQAGDTVSFHAEGADIVLCVDPASFFGGERYEIPNGAAADLTVQPGASGSFEYITIPGDLDALCRGRRDRSGGGGGGGMG